MTGNSKSVSKRSFADASEAVGYQYYLPISENHNND